MYQIEVKAELLKHMFEVTKGWRVTVDIDAMERARGGSHPTDKAERARDAEARLRSLGVTIGAHRQFGRVDIVAEHESEGIYLIEVEGESSRQKEQAFYSALGQVVLAMESLEDGIKYGIAVPDLPAWTKQLGKVPSVVAARLNLTLFAVSTENIRTIQPRK